MTQFSGMFWDMKGYLIAGAVVLAIGAAILMVGKANGPDVAKTTRWFAFPLIGCGGFLMLTPFYAVVGAYLMFQGVVAVCRNAASC